MSRDDVVRALPETTDDANNLFERSEFGSRRCEGKAQGYYIIGWPFHWFISFGHAKEMDPQRARGSAHSKPSRSDSNQITLTLALSLQGRGDEIASRSLS